MSLNAGNDIWLRQLSKGEDKAYEQLFKYYYTPLVLFADSYLNDREQSKDSVQDIFLKLVDNKEIFASIDKLKAYLYSSVKNKCLKYIRHEKVKDKYSHHILHTEQDDDYYWERVLEEEIYRQLIQAVEELPRQTRNVYKLSLKGFRNQDIAEELDISVETVKSHKKTGKQMLKAKLGGLMSLLWFLSI